MSEEEDARTLWCGNLSEKITYEVLYELFFQAGPLDKVRIPKDREGRQRNFAFVTYTHRESVPYAIDLLKGTALFDRKLSLKWQKNSALKNGNPVPSPDVAMLLGRPLSNGAPQIDPEVEQKFISMTNQLLISGLPSTNTFGDPPINFGSYDQHQSTGRLSVASLQGQWTSRHNPDHAGRRHEPYRNDRGRRGDRDRGRSDRGVEGGRQDRSGEGGRQDRAGEGGRQDRAGEGGRQDKVGENRRQDRGLEDLRLRLDRFSGRDESREYRERSRGNHSQNGNNYSRGHRNHSRD